MLPVLFRIPLKSLWDVLPDIPIHGYGFMLFLAFVSCIWLAVRLGRRNGISKEFIQDLAIWLFFGGIIGARTVFVMQYGLKSFVHFFQLWDGGLVFYGGPLGALIAYLIAHRLYLHKYQVSSWKLADVIAPCAALGLMLGRVGCLLNGCCYGNVACPDCPSLQFPLSAPPMETMVRRGYQTMAGFTLETEHAVLVPQATNDVQNVAPVKPAAAAGLQPGDKIENINGETVASAYDLNHYLWGLLPRGQKELDLQVKRGGKSDVLVGPFAPKTIGLHPTQIYESISMALLLFFLLSYFPFRRYDGLAMVLFMLGYGVHRFLNEMLRTDTDPVAFGLTLSQNISLVVLLAAAMLALAVWKRGPNPTPPLAA